MLPAPWAAAGGHGAADTPGPAGPGPGLRRPAVTVPPDAAPGPARPAVLPAGAAAGRLRLLLHPDEPGRVQPARVAAAEHWLPSPHHGGEPVPRQQARRRLAVSALWISPGEPGVDVGRAARRGHRRLAAPAHRHSPWRGHRARARRPRRQGHDRHLAVAADRRPRPADPPRPPRGSRGSWWRPRAWWRAGGCDAGVPGRFGGSRWRADRGCQAIWLWPSGRFRRIL